MGLESLRIIPYPITLALSSLLGYHGKRSGSLALSGAIASSFLGYITLANPLKVFGVCLLTFYFSGSKATKVKAAFKASLEEEEGSEHNATKSKKPGGNRTAYQVACNAMLGSLCALTWRALFSGELMNDAQGWKGDGWCSLDARAGWSKALVLGAVSFWSACSGDTFASELGMLASSSPVLITSLRPVPPGTNGGVTPWGFLVSLLGGLLVGVVASIDLALENTACRTLPLLDHLMLPIFVGGASGFVGSLIDSLLGASLQESLYSKTRKKVVHSRALKEKDEVIERVAGRAFLSNNAVNIISSTVTASAVIWWWKPL